MIVEYATFEEIKEKNFKRKPYDFWKSPPTKYELIAWEILPRFLNYKARTKGLDEVFDIVISEHGKYNEDEKLLIINSLIHAISVEGYDIDNIKPLTFKKWR